MRELFQDGWISDRAQKVEAEREGVVADVDALLSLAEIFTDDASQIPPVVSWESFDKILDECQDVASDWWNYPGVDKLFTPSQSYRPNCAGFAMANASQARLIIQTMNQWSEQKPQKFNPMATWLLSKGGSASGGQTLSKIARYGNQTGNYLAADIGDYDPAIIRFKTDDEANTNASVHQIGVCYYEGSDAATDVLRALKKGFTVFLGQSVGVRDGIVKDENGVGTVRTGGSWAHATAFAGYQKVNDVEYAFWINSHGNIYAAGDGTPDFGGWMSRDVLKRFLSSSFCDICFVTYCEAPPDESVEPTLRS